MNRILIWVALLVVGVLLCWVVSAEAQEPTGTLEQMTAVLRYAGVESTSQAEAEQLLLLWNQAQRPGLTQEQRANAFRDMFIFYSKLRGRDISNRPQAVMPLATFAATSYENGARMYLDLPEPRGVPHGDYLNTQTFGTGPQHVLLIGDAGTDARKIYGSFVERNSAKYTMHVVTLPSAGAAKQLPYPPTADATQLVWLNHIEQELVRLVDARKWSKLVALGTAGGGYFAARLALARPAALRAAVLVETLVATPVRSSSNPDAPATIDERKTRVRARMPYPQLFPYMRVPGAAEVQRLLDNPDPNHPSVQNWMSFAVKDNAISKQWTHAALSSGFFLPGAWYGTEFAATDLSDAMRKLTVPTLVMAATHDEGSRGQGNPTLSQWLELKLRDPKLPLTTVSFADTRAYISADAPAQFDAALEAFLAGRAPEGSNTFFYPRSSPRAALEQWLGRTRVHITYGRPRVNGRKVWGELVPNGRVWRAGANEATVVSFSTPVSIEGKPLAAGTYTFFTIPGEKEWTVIFNRVSHQWGAFNYNAEFDALRFPVTPTEAQHEEYLSYAIEPSAANAGRIVLRWEKLQVAFKVEGQP